MANPDKLTYIKLEDDLFWSTRCQGFAFGELLNDYKVPDFETDFIKGGEVYSIFDSGSSTIQLPVQLYEPYLAALFIEVGKEVESKQEYGVGVFVPCDETYPELHFLFDKTWLQVSPEDYVVDVSDGKDGSQCLMLITADEEDDVPFLVMGLPLYTGYYAVHDDAKGRIGFVPHVGSDKKGPYYAASNPSVDLRDAVKLTDYDDLSNHDSQDKKKKS